MIVQYVGTTPLRDIGLIVTPKRFPQRRVPSARARSKPRFLLAKNKLRDTSALLSAFLERGQPVV